MPNTLIAVGGAAVAGDYDNDGRLDLLVSGSPDGSSAITKLYHNDGGCRLSDSGVSLAGVMSGAEAWATTTTMGGLTLRSPVPQAALLS